MAPASKQKRKNVKNIFKKLKFKFEGQIEKKIWYFRSNYIDDKGGKESINNKNRFL